MSKRKCLILGDFNINTLVKSTIAKEYLNLIHSEGFNPLILEATRVTESTTSCIDHILSNFVSSSTSGSIALEIADHLPVFTLSYDPTLSPFPNKIVPNQYGFRSGMTTVDCLVDLIDEITKALDEEIYAISIFLDLSKAFDTVNHSILLSKLHVYGIRDIENQWFRSYLNKRKQTVFVNGVESDFLEVNSGVNATNYFL